MRAIICRVKQSQLSDYQNSAIYRRLMEDPKAMQKPISRLRALLAVGLGRSSPVSQSEFAHWCAVGRDTIIIAEGNAKFVSKRLAGRIWEISGAELSWLTGQRPLEDFDYEKLIEWYPGKIPSTVKDIENLHDFGSTPYMHALNYVYSAVGRDCLRNQSDPSLPSGIFKMMEAKFSDRPSTSRSSLWMSAAFAPNMVAIKTLLKWGVLDEAPEIDIDYYRETLRDENETAKTDGKVWSELIHTVTALCGRKLRERLKSPDGATTKPIATKPTPVIEEEPETLEA